MQAKYFPHTAQQSQITLLPSGEAKASSSQSSRTGAKAHQRCEMEYFKKSKGHIYFPEIVTKARDISIFLKLQ